MVHHNSSRLTMKLRRAPTRYVPVARIATGGMAEVWKAEAVFEGGESHPVAIKRVLPELLRRNPIYRSMFQDEARLGMLLRHKNIVRVYDAREVGGTFIMVMELVDGTPLRSLLVKAHRRGACMPVPSALYLARELASALAYAHHIADETGRPLGIIHRDVSPHNLLLSRSGMVKLTDFGLADASMHETARQDLVGGKLGYLAPEVVRQTGADHRIDLFAVGIVMWEMLAGRRLFEGATDTETVQSIARCNVPPLSRVNDRVPRSVEQLVARLLMREPDRRPPEAVVVVEEIDRLITELDAGVGERDVALMVGLHLASEQATKAQDLPGIADLLAQELDQFVRASSDGGDLGATPLNPSEFDGGAYSGVRRNPNGKD